jgi:hypothetical protein
MKMNRPEPIVGSTRNMTIYVEWLEAERDKLREALEEARVGFSVASDGGGINFYQYEKDAREALEAGEE